MKFLYDGKPFDYEAPAKYVGLVAKTTEPITIQHGCIQKPIMAQLVMSDSEVIMTVQCIRERDAIITFSTAPCNALICFW